MLGRACQYGHITSNLDTAYNKLEVCTVYIAKKNTFKCAKDYKANIPLRAAMIHHSMEQ